MYKRQVLSFSGTFCAVEGDPQACKLLSEAIAQIGGDPQACLLYKSDVADERSSVALGGGRVI